MNENDKWYQKKPEHGCYSMFRIYIFLTCSINPFYKQGSVCLQGQPAF